jgi:hypothetical protein
VARGVAAHGSRLRRGLGVPSSSRCSPHRIRTRSGGADPHRAVTLPAGGSAYFQVGGFIRDPEVREQFGPLLFRQFEDQASSIGPFQQLNADLIPAGAPCERPSGRTTPISPPPTGSASRRCAPTARQPPSPAPPTSPHWTHQPTSPERSSTPPPHRSDGKAGTGAEGAAGIRCSRRNVRERAPSAAVSAVAGENTSGRGGTRTPDICLVSGALAH